MIYYYIHNTIGTQFKFIKLLRRTRFDFINNRPSFIQQDVNTSVSEVKENKKKQEIPKTIPTLFPNKSLKLKFRGRIISKGTELQTDVTGNQPPLTVVYND